MTACRHPYHGISRHFGFGEPHDRPRFEDRLVPRTRTRTLRRISRSGCTTCQRWKSGGVWTKSAPMSELSNQGGRA
jgi:hypothetical protein